jgi:hypothetical protein
MPQLNYAEKKGARIERFRELADKKQAEGTALIDRAHEMADMIPFGQPILVGHYSEKRDRNFRDRIGNTWDRGFKTLETAEYYARRADNAESNRAISSDDPEAIRALKEKLQNLKASHELMVQGNKIIRNKKLTPAQKVEELIKIGLESASARAALEPDSFGDVGFPKYAITNSGANIRNVEKRIEILEQGVKEVTTEQMIGDISIINSVEENRVMIMFPGIPDEAIREKLKRDGFRWSPSNGAWQAYRSAAWKIPGIVRFLVSMPGYVSPAGMVPV